MKRNIILFSIVLFLIGCGENNEIKENINEDENLEKKYEKIHLAKWQEKRKEYGEFYTYKQYLFDETQKELDNPIYKTVSLKYCDLPVRDFVELEEETYEGRSIIGYMDDSYENRFIQYFHSYHIFLLYIDKSEFLEELEYYFNDMEDKFQDLENDFGKLERGYKKYEYNGFEIYSHGSMVPELGIGNSYLLYGNNMYINIGRTTEKEIKYMIDYCNKTRKK